MLQRPEFYKANLLQINRLSSPSRYMYFRLGNASTVLFLWWQFTWRRHWLPETAYQMGWDAAFRQFYGIDAELQFNAMNDRATLQTRVAEQRNEAVESIREACPDDRHMYYEQFLNYRYCPYCSQRLHS